MSTTIQRAFTRWAALIVAALTVVALVPAMSGRAAGATPALTLVSNGRPSAVILWWSRGQSPVAQFAAQQLQSYVERMSGTTLPVRSATVDDPARVTSLNGAVVVATGAAAGQYGPGNRHPVITSSSLAAGDEAAARAAGDSFAVDTVGDDVLTLTGAGDRGVLYAAYALLEHLGARFFAPDFGYYQGTAETVPHRSTVATAPLTDEQQADLALRRRYVEEGWSHDPATLRALIDWMAKARLNTLVYPYDYDALGLTRYDQWRAQLLPELTKRGIDVEVGGHGYTSWLPPDKYPQFYVSGYNVFDTTNPAAVQAYIDAVVAYLQARPEIKIFDAWPPDGARWPPTAIAKYGSVANAEAALTRQLTEAVDSRLPGVRVEVIAYEGATQPPSSQYMYDPAHNIVDIAPFGRSYRVPINDPSSSINANFDRLMHEWRSVFSGEIGIYEYYVKYSFHSLPVDLPKLIATDMAYEGSLGINGFGIYSEPANWLTYELNEYETAALSWNTGADATALVGQYLADRFGPPAAGRLQHYFDLVEDAGRQIFGPSSYGGADPPAIAQARQDYLEAKTALDQALQATAPTSAAHLLTGRLLENLEYAQADTDMAYYFTTGDTNAEREAAVRSRVALEAYRFDGVVLQNLYSMGRYTSGLNRSNTAWIYAMYRNPAQGTTDPSQDVPVPPGGKATITVGAQSVDAAMHEVQWSAQAPRGITFAPSSGDLTVVPGAADAGAVPSPDAGSVPVTVSALPGTPPGKYPVTVNFRSDGRDQLLPVHVTVVVATPGDLSPYFNNTGMSADAHPAEADFDTGGCSYSDEALADAGIQPGGPVESDGIRFSWPSAAPGTADNLSTRGDDLTRGETFLLPPGATGSRLAFIGADAPGNGTEIGMVTYTDGTTQYFTIGFGDWTLRTNREGPQYGNRVVATLPYFNCASGKISRTAYVFETETPLQPGKPISAVELFYQNSRARFHVFDVEVG